MSARKFLGLVPASLLIVACQRSPAPGASPEAVTLEPQPSQSAAASVDLWQDQFERLDQILTQETQDPEWGNAKESKLLVRFGAAASEVRCKNTLCRVKFLGGGEAGLDGTRAAVCKGAEDPEKDPENPCVVSVQAYRLVGADCWVYLSRDGFQFPTAANTAQKIQNLSRPAEPSQ